MWLQIRWEEHDYPEDTLDGGTTLMFMPRQVSYLTVTFNLCSVKSLLQMSAASHRCLGSRYTNITQEKMLRVDTTVPLIPISDTFTNQFKERKQTKTFSVVFDLNLEE